MVIFNSYVKLPEGNITGYSKPNVLLEESSFVGEFPPLFSRSNPENCLRNPHFNHWIYHLVIWAWVKIQYPSYSMVDTENRLKPVVSEVLNFDPYPFNSSPWKDPPIFKFGKPSISIRAIYTMANC